MTSLTAVKDNWPTNGWGHQNYAEANINGSLLQSIRDSIPEKHSLLIVKDGYIVHESYQDPYSKDSLIHINSCTKSVISILFGMIFKDQLIWNENNPAIDYFPEYQIMDTSIHMIKVRHFLSMSSGLDWKGGIDAVDVIKMSQTDDWAKYVFNKKVEHTPGEEFHYNSGGSQVISTILHKKANSALDQYARDSLFKPLGIKNFKWDKTSKGVPKAGWGLHMRIEDMAKLGYLLLNNGKWDNQQLLPKEWVIKATTKQVYVNETFDYGYQFWLPKDLGVDSYFFRGGYPPSTKIIAVIPDLNTVIVYVGENYDTSGLIKNYIVRALQNI